MIIKNKINNILYIYIQHVDFYFIVEYIYKILRLFEINNKLLDIIIISLL